MALFMKCDFIIKIIFSTWKLPIIQSSLLPEIAIRLFYTIIYMILASAWTKPGHLNGLMQKCSLMT